MSGFLYFFPDKAAIGTLAEVPPECNLGHLEGAVHFRSVLSGPGGRSGIVLSVKDERIGYYPEKQEWTEVVDSAGAITHWIGFDKENRPTPDDLRRKEQQPGSVVNVAGQSWILCCVHAPLHSFPTRYLRQQSGWKEQIAPEYAELVEECARFREAWHNPKTDEKGQKQFPTNDEICSFVCRMFSVNYMLGEWECGLLGITDSRHWNDVLKIAWGLRAFEDEEAAKKKESIPENT